MKHRSIHLSPYEICTVSAGDFFINLIMENIMKHYIKTITWKFKDSAESYPKLKNKRVKITCPTDLVENFSFCLTERSRRDLLCSG